MFLDTIKDFLFPVIFVLCCFGVLYQCSSEIESAHKNNLMRPCQNGTTIPVTFTRDGTETSIRNHPYDCNGGQWQAVTTGSWYICKCGK